MIIVIPARHGSTRLPAKALLDIDGMPLIQHVYQCARRSDADRVVVATDHEDIKAIAEGFGAEVCMTSATHRSGTERLAEVVDLLGIADDEIIVNLQGDEPLMPVSIINQVAHTLEHSDAPMSTACHEIDTAGEILNPNVVKVIFDRDGKAIYFSRSVIPHLRDERELNAIPPKTYYRHIGIYAYRARFIKTYVSWPACEIERHESLEQLRVLWNGEDIAVCVSDELPGPGVDTAADLDRVRELLGSAK